MLMNHMNINSRPDDLKITDIKVTDVVETPMHCILVKVYTSQGLAGYGEVRDDGSRNYILALKSRLIGENPCNTDKLFRRIKQFGSPTRQDGGICGIELALQGLAGRAYGIPVYQMLRDKFRGRIRMYCDTDIEGKHTDKEMGEALRRRVDRGFTFLKADLGIDLLYNISGALCVPLEVIGDLNQSSRTYEAISCNPTPKKRSLRNQMYDMQSILHPFTRVRVTEYGYDILEQYVKDVGDVIGHEVPLAIDRFGRIGIESCIRLARRIEECNIAWVEDLIPWQLADQYVRLKNSTAVPICTGKDIYLKENFRLLLGRGGVSVIYPDILTSGGVLENRRIGDMAREYGVAMVIHMAKDPIACMTAAHSVAATESFLALGFHSVDVPQQSDLITGLLEPIVDSGCITVPGAPDLGIKSLEDEVMRKHLHPGYVDMWTNTADWDDDYSYGRTWS